MRPLLITAFLLLPLPAFAGDPLAIQDNSFLIEEAYNQERGIVQHIFTFSRDRDRSWTSTFTQEWPAGGQKHQLSYTVPFQRLAAAQTRGVGDVLLNYRYQMIGSGETRVAFSPRLSLSIPSGDDRRALGSGGYGYDTNLPLSVVITPRVVTHWNLGVAKTPSSAEQALWSGGGSVIFAALPKVHLMLESRWTRDRESSVTISPGVRWAHDFRSGLQVVPGIAMPVDTRTHDRSVFLYLSLEHPFMR